MDAAFSPTGYTPVSDNEHIIYLNSELQVGLRTDCQPLDLLPRTLQAACGCLLGLGMPPAAQLAVMLLWWICPV